MPLDETFINTLPESAAVKTTVAPAAALLLVTLACGPVGATVKAKAPVWVVAPVTARVPGTVTLPDVSTKKPAKFVACSVLSPL